jgi:tetratricopeptide (TPR) repeat protein
VSLASLALAALTAVHFPVTTSDPIAQASIDRGLLFYYAYDGADAADAFAAAAVRDPNLAMAYWGEALADGPDLNTAMSEERFLRAQIAIEKAVALERYASDGERRDIDALARRYKGAWTDWKDDDAAYRGAMSLLAENAENTTGNDVATVLAAEALLENGGFVWTGSAPATPDSRRALALVNRVLRRDPENVMANHLCIHLYDGAAERAPALACARRIDAADLPPQAEHLAHMPSHFWIETGNYAAAVASSERAYKLFMQLQRIRDRNPDHDRYLIHDVYVGYSGAMMLDDYAGARAWSARMNAAYGTPFDSLTAFRFGHFAEAYSLARDTTPSELAVRGLAAVELGRDADVLEIAAQLRKLTTSGDLVQLFFARVAERDGHYDEAARWTDRAVTTQHDTFADELIPLLPALEERGALAMRRAAFAEAADAYRAALAAYPNDPRALAGLDAARKAQGRGP